jgi:heat shock protein HslJ
MRIFIAHLALLLILFGCKTASNTGIENLNRVEDLNNLWILTSMKGVDVDEVFGDQKPQININMPDNKVTGFGGCNNYFGGISIERDSIKIGPLGSTMMACPTLEGESKYMKLLENIDGFEVEDLKLTLLRQDEPVLSFEKLTTDH